ncbi:MAG: CinA-like protein [Planctomycetia bacterium]|nr:competence/damage-inducible protein A [Planctomycetota bacterium]OQZ06151.1 MAG: competence/damage-inducible protein A [Planctomycetes bacterium UTPLA1]
MKAQILAIGTELAIGQAVDTNSAWLAQQLAAMGIHTSRHVTVTDNLADITDAIRDAAANAELVLISGGLGPTADDLTRDALAAALGVELVLHPECLEQIAAYFASRRREMHERNRVQAMIPAGATPIENPRGTAPGIRAKLGRATVFVMPGVPSEMKAMYARDVLPAIRTMGGAGEVIVQRILRTFGMAESELGERISDLMARGRNPAVGTSAADLIISIRINAHGKSTGEAAAMAERDVAAVRERIGTYVFGEGDDELQTAVGRLLIDQGKTISTAESCTGGLVAKRLTDVSGSSAYFIQSFVTYSNEAKSRLLEIPPELIASNGAVSEPVAKAMAENCRRLSATDYALAVTGIAGPTGGTPDKPVGLVFVALATAERTIVRELRLGETITREEVRDRSAKAVVNLLRLELMHQLR